VLFRAKSLYSFWLDLYKKFPKPERFGIGQKIDNLLLETLENIFTLRFAKSENKIIFIERSINKIDKLKFLLEICWENKLISSKQQGSFLEKLENVGRELGGWKKTLTKTPVIKTRETS